MGARKIFEDKVLELMKALPEEDLPKVVSMVESLKENSKSSFEKIKEGRGKFKGILSSTEEFLERKRQDRLLDR